MTRTTLRLSILLVLSSTLLSLVPLAAAQPDPVPILEPIAQDVIDLGRYLTDTVFDIAEGLLPTVFGVITTALLIAGGIVEDADALVDRVNEDVITPIRENAICNVQEIVSRCD